ncbi:MAG: hypothetical protein QOK35_2471 [Pseudonocardiales bacterium]|jgi:hypothetical protein|nr:hypothetical protein [Pseudonocardiales bacterium]
MVELRGRAASRARRLAGTLAGAAAALALVACGGGVEGTVVAKTHEGGYDYGCQAGGTMSSPVAVPAWGVCAAPKCWRLIVQDNDGNRSEPCVDRAVYDRIRVGDFWHERTDG